MGRQFGNVTLRGRGTLERQTDTHGTFEMVYLDVSFLNGNIFVCSTFKKLGPAIFRINVYEMWSEYLKYLISKNMDYFF